MIMPIPEILVPIIILMGAPCKIGEYDPIYKYCSDYHCDHSDRRKDSEFYFDSLYRIRHEEYPHSDQHPNYQDSD
jgi:hypothetical protein